MAQEYSHLSDLSRIMYGVPRIQTLLHNWLAYHRFLGLWELMENSSFMEVDKMPVLEINHPLFFHSFNNLTTRSPFSRL